MIAWVCELPAIAAGAWFDITPQSDPIEVRDPAGKEIARLQPGERGEFKVRCRWSWWRFRWVLRWERVG